VNRARGGHDAEVEVSVSNVQLANFMKLAKRTLEMEAQVMRISVTATVVFCFVPRLEQL
jgi:hypothetical protein